MMIRSVFVAGLVSTLGLGGAALAAPTTWEIDPAHSSASFSVRHMMVSNVRGELGKVAGVLTLDDKDVTKSSVEATVEAGGVDTRDPKRDEHLKGPDFLDVSKHPNLTFKSNKVQKVGGGRLRVTGMLTLRGVTKEVVLDTTGPTKPVQDPWGNQRIGATATTKLKRQDYGITWNLPLNAGAMAVGDDVNVTLELEFVNKAVAAPAAGGTGTPAPSPSQAAPPKPATKPAK